MLTSIADLDLSKKRVLLRLDLNVPIKDGEVTSDERIKASLPSIEYALKHNAAVIILSHLGRPTPEVFEAEFSLEPVAKRLEQLLKKPVRFERDWLDGVDVKPGEVVLAENVRFNAGETNNDSELAKRMAELGDVFVMDAFATAHRCEASTVGIVQYAKQACAGLLLMQEMDALKSIMDKPKRPLVAIVGGSKVSTKLKLLDALSKMVDVLIVGGGIANTFIAANGYSIGNSLYEADLLDEAERIQRYMANEKKILPLPADVVVAEKLSASVESYDESIEQVAEDEKIFDIGPETAKAYVKLIESAGTILWNGPVGAFEIDQFAHGTETIAKAIAKSKAFSVAGGGDTLAAIEKYGVVNDISYISTGGGAFLNYLEGKDLPAIAALKEACTK